MSIADAKLIDKSLYIMPAGRIDSANAEQIEAEINECLLKYAHDAVVMDIEHLEYISSAGLRVILRLRKNEPTLRLINASGEVYEIFEMTGFTEILPVEKAYRRLSVEGCEVIGQGANGKVYRLDEDTIIKVFLNQDSLAEIQRERELARKAFIMGVPTAIPYDVVRVGDGYGSVYELISAKSMAKRIAAEPEKIDEYIEMYVELMKKIHSTEVKPGEVPDMKSVALKWADFLADYLPEEQYAKLRGLVEAVPEVNRLLHGDYHIKNVMIQNGEALLIDMDTLCMGHPVFELASMFMAYVGFGESDGEVLRNFLGVSRETAGYIWDKTLRLYFETDDEEKLREYEDKARVIGYTRMMRRTIRRDGFETESGRRNIEHCRKKLAELLEKVTTLTF